MSEIKSSIISSRKRAIQLFIGALVIGLLMIAPYNYICKFTNKCEPIILSFYLPKKTGQEEFRIIFEAKDNSEEIDFSVKNKIVNQKTGTKITVYYEAANFTDHDIEIRPMPYILPEEAKKYVKFYDCLCFSKHKIKKGKVVNLPVRLRLDPAIEKDEDLAVMPAIRIGYEVK